MQKRVALLILTVLCAGSAAALLLRNHSNKEPYYNGKPLHYWLLALYDYGGHANGDQTSLTLSHLDTNAFPYLIEWIQFDPPAWRAKFARRLRNIPPRGLLSPVANQLQNIRRYRLADGSTAAFAHLGSNAVPAIDPLVNLMNHGGPDTSRRATRALGNIGTNSLPALLKVVQNPQHPRRKLALSAIHDMWIIQLGGIPLTISNAVIEVEPHVFDFDGH